MTFELIELPRVIGVCGAAGSGKSTACDLIHQNFPHFQKAAFADELKETLCSLFGWTREQLDNFEFKESVDPNWGFTPRRAAQLLGTEFGRALKKDLWVDIMDKKTGPLLISDVRFENEVEWVRANGVLIHILTESKKVKTTSFKHQSEAGVAFKDGDISIMNHHESLEMLEAQILDALRTKFMGSK